MATDTPDRFLSAISAAVSAAGPNTFRRVGGSTLRGHDEHLTADADRGHDPGGVDIGAVAAPLFSTRIEQLLSITGESAIRLYAIRKANRRSAFYGKKSSLSVVARLWRTTEVGSIVSVAPSL